MLGVCHDRYLGKYCVDDGHSVDVDNASHSVSWIRFRD